MTGKSARGGEERPLCCAIKGVGAGGERRKRREEQKKGKGGGGREGEESGGERAVLPVHI